MINYCRNVPLTTADDIIVLELILFVLSFKLTDPCEQMCHLAAKRKKRGAQSFRSGRVFRSALPVLNMQSFKAKTFRKQKA